MTLKTARVLRALLPVAACTLLAGTTAAAPINQTAYGLLTVTGSEDFETVAAAPFPGTNIDLVLDLDGASFAERFSGQTLGASGSFDSLSGVPSGLLSLVAGSAGQNLVAADAGGIGIAGLGPLGYPIDDANGEGALSILFDIDSSEFGIQIRGTNSGSATFEFFRRDGSSIDTVTLLGLSDGFYGFTRDASVVDIAGVSITNDDAGGIGFDNLRFRIPEPGTGLLLGIGLVTHCSVVRRRKRAT